MIAADMCKTCHGTGRTPLVLDLDNSTSRSVRMMPQWARDLRNSATVALDRSGAAHLDGSACARRAGTVAKTDLVHALIANRWCWSCRRGSR